MKHIIIKSIAYIIPIIALCLPVYSFPETTTSIDSQDGQIEVRAKTFEVNTPRSTVTFFKDIEAVRNDLKINCQKLVIFLAKNNASNDAHIQIEKIEATKKVKISRSDGSTLTAEKAVYYLDDNKVIMTGNPVLKRGGSFTECSKITLDLNEGRYYFEGPEDGKARAVFFPPKKEKR